MVQTTVSALVKGTSLVEWLWQTTHDLKVPGSITHKGYYFCMTICLMDVGGTSVHSEFDKPMLNSESTEFDS